MFVHLLVVLLVWAHAAAVGGMFVWNFHDPANDHTRKKDEKSSSWENNQTKVSRVIPVKKKELDEKEVQSERLRYKQVVQVTSPIKNEE